MGKIGSGHLRTGPEDETEEGPGKRAGLARANDDARKVLKNTGGQEGATAEKARCTYDAFSWPKEESVTR